VRGQPQKLLPVGPWALVLALLVVAGCGANAPNKAASSASGTCDLGYVTKQIADHTGIAPWAYPGDPIDARKAAGKTIFSIQENSANPFTNTIVAGMKDVAARVGMKVIDYPNQGERTQWIQGIEQAIAQTLPAACRAPVRFMLEVEISTIYKKADRTRKIHHLIYAPDFETVDRMSARLARIGNIASDGRPILGLDSRDLLEIALESGPHAYLVPAHIWTPWFAALGSQSGFDSITECYGDLADRIFAVETGLSSDPPMNWRVSFLVGAACACLGGALAFARRTTLELAPA